MSRTLHLDAAKPQDIARAAAMLRDGRLVAFATETVYGLGANAHSSEAVARIFAAKQRPSWDPLIVHLASDEKLSCITQIPPAMAQRISILTSSFWPGPLTLLLPRNSQVPDAVTSGRPLVGVRVPAHPAAQALLRACSLPIAAPSANLFGHTSPTSAAHVLADLDGRIDAVLDGGTTQIGLESTVIDPLQTPMVLYRPGAVTAQQLEAATGVSVQIFAPAQQTHTSAQALPSPGVGIRHYAPRAKLVLVEGNEAALHDALERQSALQRGLSSQTIGVLLPLGWRVEQPAHVYPWGPWNDPEALATKLFAGIRSLDDHGVTLIVCPLPAPGGIGDAIRDRLEKAARTA